MEILSINSACGIESMAADFAAKRQVKLPVLEDEIECSPPSLTPGNPLQNHLELAPNDAATLSTR